MNSQNSERKDTLDTVELAEVSSETEPEELQLLQNDDDEQIPETVDFRSSKKAFIVSIILIFSYLLVGVAFYSIAEQWNVGDSLYFTVVTLATVGYGDFAPTLWYTKLATILYIFIGITGAAYALSLVGSYLLKRQEELLEKMKNKGHESEITPKKNKFLPQLTGATRDIVFVLISLVFIFSLGTAFVSLNEGHTFVDSLFWSVVTCTTVGYGDIPLRHRSTRIFAVFFILIGTFALANAIGTLANIFVEAQQQKIRDKIIKRKLSVNSLNEMDADKSGSVNQQEFLEFMLVKTGRVSQENIDEIKAQFKALDVDNSGTLDKNDLKDMQITKN